MTAARLAAIAATAGMLSACYHGPGTNSPVVDRAYPPGVLSASPAPAPTGLYAARFFGAYNCCWMQKSATFQTTVARGARAIRVMVSLPPQALPYDTRPEAVDVRVAGAPARTFRGLRSGIFALDVPLAPRASGAVTVRVDAAYTAPVPGTPFERSLQIRGVHTL